MNFKKFYFEEVVTAPKSGPVKQSDKNTPGGAIAHLDHLEDLLILFGKDGFKRFVSDVNDVLNFLRADRGDTKTRADRASLSEKIDGCIHEDTLIETSEGPIKISDIVEKSKDFHVWTFNEETQKCELNLVEYPRINNNNKKWVRVDLEDGPVICTEDHEFFVNEFGWRKARDLIEGDDILEIKKD